MENLIAKYTALKADCDKQIKATGIPFEREYLRDRSDIYKSVISDLEAAHRNCSCRTGLKWNQANLTEAEQDILEKAEFERMKAARTLNDREQFFTEKED